MFWNEAYLVAAIIFGAAALLIVLFSMRLNRDLSKYKEEVFWLLAEDDKNKFDKDLIKVCWQDGLSTRAAARSIVTNRLRSTDHL